MPKYEVFCRCPTPLAENPCEVTAANEAEAMKKFFDRNGIGHPDHQVDVVALEKDWHCRNMTESDCTAATGKSVPRLVNFRSIGLMIPGSKTGRSIQWC